MFESIKLCSKISSDGTKNRNSYGTVQQLVKAF
jgi:hypothetical protein